MTQYLDCTRQIFGDFRTLFCSFSGLVHLFNLYLWELRQFKQYFTLRVKICWLQLCPVNMAFL